jgi:hypothetical protein
MFSHHAECVCDRLRDHLPPCSPLLLSLELSTEASDPAASLFASLEEAEGYSELGPCPALGSGTSSLAFSVANANACSSVSDCPLAQATSNAAGPS